MDASGFAGNDCPPDLDLSSVPDQTVAIGETLTLDLLAAGGTLTDLDSGGQPTGDVLRLMLDPDSPDDVPLGVSLSSGVLTWTPTVNQIGTHTIVVIGVDTGSPALADAEVLTVDVTDSVNQAPTVDLNGSASGIDTSASFVEDGGIAAIVDAALAISDADDTNLNSASVTITNLADGIAESLAVDATSTSILTAYNSTTGVLSLAGVDSIAAYEQVLRSLTYNNTSDNPNTTVRTVTISVNDGLMDSPVASSLVSVTAVNDAPVVDLNGGASGVDTTASFTDGGGAIAVVDATLVVSDVDHDALDSATVVITNLLDGAAESLAVDLGTTSLTATYNSTTGVLTLTGNETLAGYQQVLRTLVYNNTSQNPDATDRVIEVTVHDGSASSASASSVISTILPNTAPDLAPIADEVTFIDRQVEVVVTATDSDGDDLTFQIDDDLGAPANATLQQTSNSTAIVRWTPTDSDGLGDFDFRILVTDSGTPPKSDSELFTVTVGNPVEVAAAESVVVSGATLPTLPSVGTDPAVGSSVPEFSTLTNTGELTEITYDGTVSTLIGFVSHWCSHCQTEVPMVVDWLNNNDLPANVRLVLVSTSVSETADNYPPSEWLVQENWPSDVLVDTQGSAIAAAHGIPGFPYWVSVDADGRVITRHAGAVTAEEFTLLVARTSVGLMP